MVRIKYNGRTVTSVQSLATAFKRDLVGAVETQLRNAAAKEGLSLRKTINGYELVGQADKVKRFVGST